MRKNKYIILILICFLSHSLVKAQNPTDKVVCIKGNNPSQSLAKGLEVLGGLKEFIKPHQRVLIVPTMFWDKTPEQGINANPQLVAALVKACYQAGASSVHVLAHTADSWTKCYKNSGIERASKNAGARVLPANKEFLYETAQNPGGKMKKTLEIHKDVFETDIIINVTTFDPKLNMTGAFYNLLGLSWNWSMFLHDQSGEKIAELALYCNPVLTIWDGSNNLKGKNLDQTNKHQNFIILSRQMIKGEYVAAKLVGIQPDSLTYLKSAARLWNVSLEPIKDETTTIQLQNK